MTKGVKNSKSARRPAGMQAASRNAVRSPKDHQAGNLRARAQELALQAQSMESSTRQLELALKALVLNPRCTDALIILSDVFDDPDEYTEAMHLIVQRAEEDLDPELFQREQGHFWEIVETRPYMRARLQLAMTMIQEAKTSEAIAELEELLKLDLNDHQGVRFPLVRLYFETNKLDRASSLLTRFADDASAQFAWLRVMLAAVNGDLPLAEEELQKARAINRHVEKYLSGKNEHLEEMPHYHSFGDMSEAVLCADEIADSWTKHPEALRWLKTHTARTEKKRKR